MTIFNLKPRQLIMVGTGLVILAAIVCLIIPYAVVAPNNKYVLDAHDKPAVLSKHIRIGIVMGAGITKSGKPFRELEARLNVAASALNAGYVDKLILTGDNRFHNYDEPGAMITYLTEVKHIPRDKLQPDYAGRDTYQSCERAAKVFGVQRTIIFSAGSHLPRAIFLCRSFGIEAYGIASNIEANNSHRREMLARAKALLNVYIYGEKTILGKPIKV